MLPLLLEVRKKLFEGNLIEKSFKSKAKEDREKIRKDILEIKATLSRLEASLASSGAGKSVMNGESPDTDSV